MNLSKTAQNVLLSTNQINLFHTLLFYFFINKF